MRTILRTIIDRLSTPRSSEDWYDWAGMAALHFMLGLFAVMFLPPALIMALYVAKEANDVFRRGGDPWDSVLDTGMVALGVAFTAFPMVVLWLTVVTMLAGVVSRIVRFPNALQDP